MTYRLSLLLAATLPLCLLTAPAFAQIETEAETADTFDQSNGNVYLADYFTQYAPRTALDMVGQIPGFSIRSGDLSKRGLGQGGWRTWRA